MSKALTTTQDPHLFEEDPTMAYREFVDSCRIEWSVWYVAASRSERRERDTRRSEERAKGDRRRRCEPRALRMRVGAPMAGGWLCFESAGEKRRLVPVPPGWQRMSDRGLEELCARATVVAKSARQVVRALRGSPGARATRLALPHGGYLEHALPRSDN
jgi:hypothetical protein